MKNSILSILVFSFLAAPAMAQNRGMDRGQMKTMDDSRNSLIEKSIQRTLISFDYNSWFEKLSVSNTSSGATQENQALFYGFGLGLERNYYQPNWGWGFGSGLSYGSAVGGDKTGTLSYFQARVPWWSVRVTPRIFYRWTPRTDFGLDLSLFYKQSKWPVGTSGNLTAVSGSELVSGAFIDLRVRYNPKIEMIQALGVLYKDQSVYWRLGLGYRM